MNLRQFTCLAAAVVLAPCCWYGSAADDPPRPAQQPLTVIDAAGKEQSVKTWKFVAGTRHLGWLAPAAPRAPEPPVPEPKKAPPRTKARPQVGPEALEIREENSTTFVDGVLTLVPLESLRAVEFDNDLDTITVRVATGDKREADSVLTGLTKFRSINKLTIEAEVDKGDLGIAEVKFLGGVPRGIRAVRFPAPKPIAALPAGRTAEVAVADKGKKNVQQVADLRALYAFADGQERLLPTLYFKKTLKVDLAKLHKLRASESKEPEGNEWGVTLSGGEEETYTLLTKVTIDDQPATLEGLLGRAPAGYKLFPPHTIAEVTFMDGKP